VPAIDNGYRDNAKLLAYVDVVMDDSFKVTGIRLMEVDDVETNKIKWFASFPNRPVTKRCPQCKVNCNIKDKFCGMCGNRLPHLEAAIDKRGRPIFHHDCCFPIRPELRREIELAIFDAYEAEMKKTPDLSAIPT